jgi:hypothetical protein
MCYVLKRYVIEKYSSKNIDDKKLIFIKFNLIYWFEYWLFDVLLLRSIEIYLYFTIYEIKSFDVDFDSFICRFYVIFRSWCEYHEMKLFVNRSIKLSFEISCSFLSSLAESLSMIECYVFVLSTNTSQLIISSSLSIRQACLTVLITLQSIESLDSLIMLRFSASELRNEHDISDENSIERFTKKFTSWYSHHDLKTT